MRGGAPLGMIAAGILFLVVFGGLTIASLATASLNLATLVIAAVSIFVCVAVLIALVGAIRNPPED